MNSRYEPQPSSDNTGDHHQPRPAGGRTAVFPSSAGAGGGITLFNTVQTATGQDYNVKIEILILMTLLGLLPIMMLMMTCFTRFIIVLAILRQALGLQQSPPNKVLTGIALALTLLVMRPVWTKIHQDAVIPFQQDEITLSQALGRAEAPLKNYMLAQTSTKSLDQMMLSPKSVASHNSRI